MHSSFFDAAYNARGDNGSIIVGNVLSPTDMRSLLINTGTYPASGDLSIGPLPNIRAAILSLTTSLPLGLSLKK